MIPKIAKSRKFIFGFACSVGFILSNLNSMPQANPPYYPGQALVRAVRGTASYNVKNSGYRPLKVGMIFGHDTIIKTGADTQVDLFLGENGPVIRLTAETEIILSKLRLQRVGDEIIAETQVDLRIGRILGSVKRMTAASRYEVKIPRGVCSLRESRFDIRADGTIVLLTGRAIVSYFVDYPLVTLGPNQQAIPPRGNEMPAVRPANPDRAEFPIALETLQTLPLEFSTADLPIPAPPGPFFPMGSLPLQAPFISPTTGLTTKP